MRRLNWFGNIEINAPINIVIINYYYKWYSRAMREHFCEFGGQFLREFIALTQKLRFWIIKLLAIKSNVFFTTKPCKGRRIYFPSLLRVGKKQTSKNNKRIVSAKGSWQILTKMTHSDKGEQSLWKSLWSWENRKTSPQGHLINIYCVLFFVTL